MTDEYTDEELAVMDDDSLTDEELVRKSGLHIRRFPDANLPPGEGAELHGPEGREKMMEHIEGKRVMEVLGDFAEQGGSSPLVAEGVRMRMEQDFPDLITDRGMALIIEEADKLIAQGRENNWYLYKDACDMARERLRVRSGMQEETTGDDSELAHALQYGTGEEAAMAVRQLRKQQFDSVQGAGFGGAPEQPEEKPLSPEEQRQKDIEEMAKARGKGNIDVGQ